jgi:hypothetical protein
MTYGTAVEQLLRELSAPRRNHYFYGKLMDVCHFEMEQTYGNHKRWLVNQHALGAGVLCGLDVKAHDEKLWVDPGMAIDGYGREIIKPVRTSIDPWTITDQCGVAQSELSKDIRHEVTLLLCYRECLTDYMPVLVSDCGNDQASAAGTLVETFQLAIVAEVPEGVLPALDPRCCSALSARGEDQRVQHENTVIEQLRRNLCECTAGPCLAPIEPCVVLAVIELLPGGRIGTIEKCRYRQRIYSNQVLLDLILCLAARLEECCGQDEQPEQLPKVARVQLLDGARDVLAELSDPSKTLVLKRDQLVRSLRVVFTQPIAPSTVVAGGVGADPRAQSFLVLEQRLGLVPGTLAFEQPTIVRWDIDIDLFPAGRYAVQLAGETDTSVGRPAIANSAGVRLDGEPINLPSGDDAEGGSFRFRFEIVGDSAPATPPQVDSIFVISNQNIVLGYITDLRDVPPIEATAQPKSLLVYFTADINRASVVASAPRRQALNFQVTDAGGKIIPGAVTFDSATQIRWTAAASALREGTYLLQLFGDADKNTQRKAIAGISGLRLDGEATGELPSGDGIEGGEFRVSFRIVSEPAGGDR